MHLATRSGFSRIPVIGEDVDDVLGVVYLKDLIARAHRPRAGRRGPMLGELMRPPVFVPESKPVDALLREMQRDRTHFAIVVDEYGGTAGHRDHRGHPRGDRRGDHRRVRRRDPGPDRAAGPGRACGCRPGCRSRTSARSSTSTCRPRTWRPSAGCSPSCSAGCRWPARRPASTGCDLHRRGRRRPPRPSPRPDDPGAAVPGAGAGRRDRTKPRQRRGRESDHDVPRTGGCTVTAPTDPATPLDAEDAKLVTLARGARGRAAAVEGAAVRDTDGRTYAAATVALPSLQLTALQVAVAAAVSSAPRRWKLPPSSAPAGLPTPSPPRPPRDLDVPGGHHRPTAGRHGHRSAPPSTHRVRLRLLRRPAQRRQVDAAQRHGRREGGDHLGQAADHPPGHPRHPDPAGRPAGHRRHPRHAQAAHAAGRAARRPGAHGVERRRRRRVLRSRRRAIGPATGGSPPSSPSRPRAPR